jgi:hypothetical protein
VIAPGKRVTLTVKFTKKGTYGYHRTLPGHAAAGMKGKLGVQAEEHRLNHAQLRHSGRDRRSRQPHRAGREHDVDGLA